MSREAASFAWRRSRVARSLISRLLSELGKGVEGRLWYVLSGSCEDRGGANRSTLGKRRSSMLTVRTVVLSHSSRLTPILASSSSSLTASSVATVEGESGNSDPSLLLKTFCSPISSLCAQTSPSALSSEPPVILASFMDVLHKPRPRRSRDELTMVAFDDFRRAGEQAAVGEPSSSSLTDVAVKSLRTVVSESLRAQSRDWTSWASSEVRVALRSMTGTMRHEIGRAIEGFENEAQESDGSADSGSAGLIRLGRSEAMRSHERWMPMETAKASCKSCPSQRSVSKMLQRKFI